MIAKRVKRLKGTSSFGRLVNYLLDTQQDPRLLEQVPEAYTQKESNGCKVAWFDIAHCDADMPALMIDEVEATQALNTRSKNDKTYHLVVSFPIDERPDQDVACDIEQALCTGIGLGEHQRIAVAHQDTAHFHLHIAINKVHPETLNCIEPYYDHYKLDELCRALEERHQLQKDNRIEPDKERNQAQEMEAHTGEQSLLSWLTEKVKDDLLACLENVSNWQACHDFLAGYGLEIRPRGAGLVIGDPEKSVYVKASNLSRKLSLKQLEAKFGPFVQNTKPIERDPEKPVYSEAPKQKHPAAQELYRQYQSGQTLARECREQALHRLRTEHKQYVRELRAWYDRQYKSLRYSTYLRGPDKRVRYAKLARQRRDDMVRQQELFASSRQDIFKQNRYMSWTEFLQEQAQSGSEVALSVLRSQEQRHASGGQRIRPAERLAEARGTIYKGLKPEVLKNGAAVYRLPDGGQVRDEKDQILVPDITEMAIQLALSLADDRFAHRWISKGSQEFEKQLKRVRKRDTHNCLFEKQSNLER